MIGHRYRHLKRGSTYVVRKIVHELIRDRKDNQSVFFVISNDTSEYGEGPTYELILDPRKCAYPNNILFVFPVTFQISSPTPRRGWTDIAIYQCDQDGGLWARPVDEFTPDRFERIKE